MDWLKDKLINKAEIIRKLNVDSRLFYMKLNNVNYNKFSSQEVQAICEMLLGNIKSYEELHRLVLLEFCDSLSKPATDLLKMGQKRYVVEHYLTEIESKK